MATNTVYDVIVADTVNHRLRGVRLSDGEVTTLAGSGVQRLLDSERAKGVDADHIDPEADPREVALSSPWDTVWSTAADTLVVAMSGTHQIFTFDPRTGELAVAAASDDPVVALIAVVSPRLAASDSFVTRVRAATGPHPDPLTHGVVAATSSPRRAS